MPPLNSNFREQLEALRRFYEAALSILPTGTWSWGDGTVLALFHYNHRLSFDVDLFVKDEQLISLLSPKWYIDEVNFFENEYTDLPTHIQLLTRKITSKSTCWFLRFFTPRKHNRSMFCPLRSRLKRLKRLLPRRSSSEKSRILPEIFLTLPWRLSFRPRFSTRFGMKPLASWMPAALRFGLIALTGWILAFIKTR